jgi:pimeloyl-ACP methyl ester carboxylesterase
MPASSSQLSTEEFAVLPDGIRICYQTLGDNCSPAILLLAGGSQSMLAWSDDFMRQLNPSSSQHFVIRYDYRDTGRSTSYPQGESSYTLDRLAGDAFQLLDVLKIKSAHLIGFSMGGALAWIVGAKYPDRVKTLNLISTSPVGPVPGPDDNLPGLNPELGQQLAASPFPTDWHNRSQVVSFLSYFAKCMAFDHTPADAEEEERVAGLSFDRAAMEGGTVQSMFNHQQAAMIRWPRELLVNVKAPTVILHGREDGNVPLAHAHVLEKEIRGSKLIVLDGMAHEMPPRLRDKLAQEVLQNMAAHE